MSASNRGNTLTDVEPTRLRKGTPVTVIDCIIVDIEPRAPKIIGAGSTCDPEEREADALPALASAPAEARS